jgi:transcriptional regulator
LTAITRNVSAGLIGGYTIGEILWLLSLTREQAVDLDATPADSLAATSETHAADARTIDGSIPVIARWHDVQQAKARLNATKQELKMVELRAQGQTDKQVAETLGTSRQTVNRKWRATVQEILDELGGEYHESALSHIDLCLNCGKHPRAYLKAVTRKANHKTITTSPARSAAYCTNCITPALHKRVAA